MDPRPPWHQRFWRNVLQLWRSSNPRISAVRDIVVAAAVVLSILGVVWAYTGQSFPNQAPLVVVESGSMMHGPGSPCPTWRPCEGAYGSPPFSRVGTIDPGDLVLVKDVDSFDDVETAFGSGSRGGYGGHGDVLVFERSGAGEGTPIIHRAMLLILAQPEGCLPNDSVEGCTYRIPETCDAERFAAFVQPRSNMSDWRSYCSGSIEPVTFNLERSGLFLSLTSYPCAATCAPFFSGFITKGDNNHGQDQPTLYPGRDAWRGGPCCPVPIEWVIGKSRGEVPWFGMLKLALYGNPNYSPASDPTGDSNPSFLRAKAPWDIWLALVFAIAGLVLLPMAIDRAQIRVRRWRDKRSPPPPGHGDSNAASHGTSPRDSEEEAKTVKSEPR